MPSSWAKVVSLLRPVGSGSAHQDGTGGTVGEGQQCACFAQHEDHGQAGASQNGGHGRGIEHGDRLADDQPDFVIQSRGRWRQRLFGPASADSEHVVQVALSQVCHDRGIAEKAAPRAGWAICEGCAPLSVRTGLALLILYHSLKSESIVPHGSADAGNGLGVGGVPGSLWPKKLDSPPCRRSAGCWSRSTHC